MIAGFDRRAAAVALTSPRPVVDAGEIAHAGGRRVVRVEVWDPLHLLRKDVREALDAALGLGPMVMFRAARDAQVIDFGVRTCFTMAATAACSLRIIWVRRPSSGRCPWASHPPCALASRDPQQAGRPRSILKQVLRVPADEARPAVVAKRHARRDGGGGGSEPLGGYLVQHVSGARATRRTRPDACPAPEACPRCARTSHEEHPAPHHAHARGRRGRASRRTTRSHDDAR